MVMDFIEAFGGLHLFSRVDTRAPAMKNLSAPPRCHNGDAATRSALARAGLRGDGIVSLARGAPSL
jgi:hypothetical protein